ncbi:DNA-binding TFAR19-related protein [Calocera viscosa TUFC12733]|uniref:DNA-binding TFAR19-related protein n=1 Tax=Calocera viscosa (strain TUFC12733) TaxID=1330018 RepID=A0A167KZ71_CALVF|nr:DNA-binding TFAR19-related protein [Calocera viscosa TUFC12733]
MSESELAGLRNLQAGGSNQGGQGGGGEEDAAKQAQQRQAQEEAKRGMLATILDGGARERLARISLVNAPLSKSVEDSLLRMAQSGQIRSKVTEQQLVALLENADGGGQSAHAPKKTTIIYSRRKVDPDDDLDFDI